MTHEHSITQWLSFSQERHRAVCAGTAGDAEPSSTRGLADIIQRSLPRQASGKQAPQVDALAKQLTGLSTAQQDASTALMTSTQLPQQQPSFTAGAAVPTRPERPTSARRGPPKIPQTGSAGKQSRLLQTHRCVIHNHALRHGPYSITMLCTSCLTLLRGTVAFSTLHCTMMPTQTRQYNKNVTQHSHISIIHLWSSTTHTLCCWLSGRPQTPSGGMARPGTSSGRPGSALRQPAQNAPATLAPSNTIQDEEEPAAAEPRAPRQTITSARPGLAMLPGARPASAGLKRPASAAGQQPASSQSSLAVRSAYWLS